MQIEIESVTKRYGSMRALDDLSLEVPAGSRLGLVGPNGSGKSTLTRALLGMISVEGRIRLDSLSPITDRDRLAPRLAYVPQSPPRIRIPAGELVDAVVRVRQLDLDGVRKIAARLELDVDEIAARPFGALSGGMKQKLLIALALASPASLIIMDEPTAGLDVHARWRFFELCRELPASTGLILCSHRVEELAYLIDRIVVLREGRVVSEGSAANLLAESRDCRIEIRTSSDRARAWLAASGYQDRGHSWWSRSVAANERIAELMRVVEACRSELEDLRLVEAENLDPSDLLRRREPGEPREPRALQAHPGGRS